MGSRRHYSPHTCADFLKILDGGQKIQNIQPFTKRDLEIRCLGDRIRDITDIAYLYPDSPKDDVFRNFYTGDILHAWNYIFVLIFYLFFLNVKRVKVTTFVFLLPTFETELQSVPGGGYIPVTLQTRVGT